MDFKIKYLLMAVIYFTTACSSIPKGTLLGASVGLGVGSMVAHNQEDNSQKNMSLAAGALVGAAIGYFLSDEKIKKERELKAGQHAMDFTTCFAKSATYQKSTRPAKT